MTKVTPRLRSGYYHSKQCHHRWWPTIFSSFTTGFVMGFICAVLLVFGGNAHSFSCEPNLIQRQYSGGRLDEAAVANLRSNFSTQTNAKPGKPRPTAISEQTFSMIEENRNYLLVVRNAVNNDNQHDPMGVPMRPTSHAGVFKQQLIDPFTAHPFLAGISIGILESPKQHVESHSHATMSEFFYILQGQGFITLSAASDSNHSQNFDRNNNENHLNDGNIHVYKDNPQVHPVKAGSFVFVGPRRNHSLSMSETSKEPLKFLFFGLTDD